VAASPQIIKKPACAPPSFRPKRSGVEKPHFPMVHEALRQEISRLKVSSERFPSVPIPTRSPARDDGGGRHPYRHFRRGRMTKTLSPPPSFRPKRCGVEKSHFPMVHEALRQEIFRLRVSSERFPSAPIPAHSPARDDGGGGRIVAEDFRAQSVIGAVPVCPYTGTFLRSGWP
jgi:hypothetical protein